MIGYRRGVIDTFSTQQEADSAVVIWHEHEVARGAASIHCSPGYARIANLSRGIGPRNEYGVEITSRYVPINHTATEYDVTEFREEIDPSEFRLIRQLMAEAERNNAKREQLGKFKKAGPLASQYDIAGEALNEGWTHTKAMALAALVVESDKMTEQLASANSRVETLEKQLQRLRDEFRRHLRETMREGGE